MNDRQVIDFFGTLDVPEGLRAELLRGDIVMTRSPDIVHNRTVAEIADGVPQPRWQRLQCQYVEIHQETSEPVPDLVVLERGAGPESGRLLPVEAVTMLVEVVSSSSTHRDYVAKRSIYAAAGVPVYLIVDPIRAECLVLTEPNGSGERADYRSRRMWKYGETLLLSVLDIGIPTSAFPAYSGAVTKSISSSTLPNNSGSRSR